jgi:hypothetical protein
VSRQLGLDAFFLRSTPRIAHTEYSLDYHASLYKKSVRELYDAWDLDFIWCTDDGPIAWEKAGRCTDMGHGEYAAGGGDRRPATSCPFRSPQEVLDFDPLREYGLPSRRELVRFYEGSHRKRSDESPNQLFSGGYYKTLVSGAIQAFGWEMLLLAAADEERFARLLGRFGRYTLEHNLAWAETSIEVFMQHDDMVWAQGPFLRPEFYRTVIFPIYRRLWEPLKRAGKRVIFCSDGTWDMFFDDIASCGADGFCFEPSNHLDAAVKKYGRTHVIIGSKVDCRTMAFSPWEQVQAEMDATLALAKPCPGFIWAVGNHIPANVSDEVCLRYMEYLRAHWTR